MGEILKDGLPFWIAGAIIAVVISILVGRSRKSLGPEKTQELEEKVSESARSRFGFGTVLFWMVAVPLLGTLIFYILLKLFL